MENPIRTLLIIIAFSLWIIAITDIVKRRLKYLIFNFIWLGVVICFPIVGALLYLYMRRNMSADRIKKFDPNFKKINCYTTLRQHQQTNQ